MPTVLANAGKAIITARLRGTGTEPLHTAWGSGAGVAAIADTTLFTEGPEARVAGTSSQQTTTTTNDPYRVIATITASAARAVTNAGLFDAVSVGNLFVKGDFATINLASGDSIQFTTNVVFA